MLGSINIEMMTDKEHRAVSRAMLELWQGDLNAMARDTGLYYTTLTLWRDGAKKADDKPLAFLSYFLREKAQHLMAIVYDIEHGALSDDDALGDIDE